MRETWVSTQQASEISGIGLRTLRKRCEAGKYLSRKEKKKPGPGRAGYMVALSCLPAEAQKAYKKTQKKEQIQLTLKELPEWARKKALERLEILSEWERYAQERGVGTSVCVQDFIREKLPGKVHYTTLYRWKSRYNRDGAAGAAPRWRNGREKFSENTISPKAKNLWFDLYLHQGRGSMSYCRKLVEQEAAQHGWAVPSYSTFKRLKSTIPLAVVMKLRESQKKYNDHALPYVHRDPTSLDAYQMVESDHTQMDVAVQMPDGTVGFPWLTVWLDIRSWKPLAWALVSQPSSDSINITARSMFMKYGIPGTPGVPGKEGGVHIDRGKDYRARRFLGSKKDIGKVNKHINAGLYEALGLRVHQAIAYNAKSKPIERFNGILKAEFDKFLEGYRGQDIKHRPDGLQKKMRDRKVLTFDKLKELLHLYIDIEYSENRPHYGKGMEGRTPNQVFAEHRGPMRVVDEEELALLCSPWPRSLQVRESGIDFLNAWYWPDDEKMQQEYFGKKVYVRFVEDDLTKVYLFSLEGRYLGLARCQDEARWGARENPQIEKVMRMRKNIHESVKTWEKDNIGETRLNPQERADLVVKNARKQAAAGFVDQVPEEKIPFRTPMAAIVKSAKDADAERKQSDRLLEAMHIDFQEIEEPLPPPLPSLDDESDEWLEQQAREVFE